VEANLCRFFYHLFINVLRLELSRGEGWDPINRNNLTTFVPVPNQDLDFQCHMSWSFLCSVS
jgi:hypothetical protein